LNLASRALGGPAGARLINQTLRVVRRAGTAWTCAAHIITAVIGSGVLSLAWSVAQLGWVVGPACMFCFALVTYVSAALLADCYRRGDPGNGPRNRSYMDAVRVYLGTTTSYIRISVIDLTTCWLLLERSTAATAYLGWACF
jgi:hypothetical protein